MTEGFPTRSCLRIDNILRDRPSLDSILSVNRAVFERSKTAFSKTSP